MSGEIAVPPTLVLILPDRPATAREASTPMDVAAWRERATATFELRRDQAKDLVDRIPILGRLLNEVVRVEFIDRCMLIAAQGLLALIPMLVVLAAFLPDLTSAGIESFSNAAGLGERGEGQVTAQVTPDQVRAQTGLIGIAITLFSATSFARAVQRMYERIWDVTHVGGVSGTRRCFLWLLGWLMTLQLVGALRTLMNGVDGLVADGLRLAIQALLLSALWWVTSWVLLFGRVPWHRLALGAVLTGTLGLLYNRGSSLVMPVYVDANADQFGTLGVILAVSTWLIGFAAVMVGSAVVGRVVSEDPTVRRLVSSALELAAEVRRQLARLRPRPDEPAAR
ncbi:YhjD/YihY/BrkB family envelope integrity protein [Nocardioides caricicola]|uniref:YhjD/YihY/BrkB family envelope integrity protein n=1 Tax=Nocardioides caricicola TaxID=634770 RepID=A0ABW0MWF1_9ACTN